jgi:quinol monooxygenase YgiN
MRRGIPKNALYAVEPYVSALCHAASITFSFRIFQGGSDLLLGQARAVIAFNQQRHTPLLVDVPRPAQRFVQNPKLLKKWRSFSIGDMDSEVPRTGINAIASFVDSPADRNTGHFLDVDIGPRCANACGRYLARRVDAAKTASHHKDKHGQARREEFVRSIFQFLLGLIVAVAICEPPARAQSSALYLVTYIEAMPDAVAPASALLKKYRDAASREDGNLRTEVLQELERPNRFAIVETWRDKPALDAHEGSADTMEFRGKMKAFQAAPYDERTDSQLYAAQSKNGRPANALYVVTHVDVIPPGKDDCMAALKTMSVDTAADAGNISYEVLQQANRGNHFSVLEVWANRKALDGHAMAAHTRAFRAKLVPFAGALYDERIYKAL